MRELWVDLRMWAEGLQEAHRKLYMELLTWWYMSLSDQRVRYSRW